VLQFDLDFGELKLRIYRSYAALIESKFDIAVANMPME